MKNYHTHTFRCKHADGDVPDYAEAALEKGITLIGMTDHTPLPDNRWLSMRMAIDELPDYLQAVQDAKEQYPQLTILCGMECEWLREYHRFFQDELLGKHQLDYLILGSHYFPLNGDYLSSHGDISNAKRLRAYTDHLIRSMESGLFTFVAHPDLFGLSYWDWDANAQAASKDILSAAQELKLPLEINGNGLCGKIINVNGEIRPPYPWLDFWKLAREYKVEAIVTSDAHRPGHLDRGLREGLEMVSKLGLTLANFDYLEGE